VRELQDDLAAAYAAAQASQRVFAAGSRGDVVAMRPGERPERPSRSGALMVWRPLGSPFAGS
jgi:MerR family transcriptional regulator/heat shock protein HspR